MPSDSTSPNSSHRKRAYSPPHPSTSRPRDDDSSLPWWEADRAQAQSQSRHSLDSRSAGRYDDRQRPPARDYQHDREPVLDYGGGRRQDDRRDYDRDRAGHHNGHSAANQYQRGGGNYRGGPPGGRGGYQNGRGGSYSHNGPSRFPSQTSPRSGYADLNSHRPGYDHPNQHHNSPPPPVVATLAPSCDRPASPPAPAVLKSPEPELDLEVPVERDPAEVLAERRRKREAILAKYAQQSAPTSGAGTPAVADQAAGPPSPAKEATATEGSVDGEPAAKRQRVGGTDSPAGSVTKDEGEFDLFKSAVAGHAIRASSRDGTQSGLHHTNDDISAADYNPEAERANDDRGRDGRNPAKAEPRDDWRAREQAQEDKAKQLAAAAAANAAAGSDDDDDMFALDDKPVKKVGIEDAEEDEAGPREVPMIDRSLGSALLDEFDDADGYYKLLLGEVLDSGRYHVRANLGKGMFSGVVRAKDLHWKGGEGSEEVAIKVLRSQESMYKAGQKEAGILRKLHEADPTDKKHLVRLLRTFEHRGHLCLVFESLSMNLREVVKRFGKDVGINLRAVRTYASQMFLALSILRKCDIMHADIKPDNILVNESKSVLKVCDLGSASDVSENDITPYLVSRFYRAPEIILGLPYDCSLDTWSIACTLYELYTGKILFPGRTNNHMLLLIMELKGKFNVKQLKKGRFTEQHFDEQLNFMSVDKNDVMKVVAIPPKAVHDLRARLLPTSMAKQLKEDELKLLTNFVDLLDKMLSLEPAKRPSPKELLNHPFIRG